MHFAVPLLVALGACGWAATPAPGAPAPPMDPTPFVTIPADPAQAAIENLRAAQVHPGFAGALQTFGQFVGVWDLDVKLIDARGRVFYHQPNVWMFSWVLDGKAIQDVIAGPPTPGSDGDRRLGTTLRYFNAATKRWQITFLAVASGTYIQLEGGATDDGILLAGRDVDGSWLEWRFSHITPTSFLWQGFTSPDKVHWRMEQEMTARRRRAGSQ